MSDYPDYAVTNPAVVSLTSWGLQLFMMLLLYMVMCALLSLYFR